MTEWKPGQPIGYVRSEIPEFAMPAYQGQRYESMAPDTLDLADRASLVIHGMTEAADPEADFEPYMQVWFDSRPPQMLHDWCGPGMMAKFLEATPLMRIISGSNLNEHVDRTWAEVALRGLGPDGLYYSPLKGRPWADEDSPSPVHTATGQVVAPLTFGKLLSAMAVLAYRDGGSVWRDASRRLVDGIIGLAVDAGDIAYFWPDCMDARKERPASVEAPTKGVNQESSRTPHGLVHAYRLLGYEPALTLAGKIINYMRRYFYGADGSFMRIPGDSTYAHFHAHAHGLLAMQDYAETADDQEVMEFVVRSFEFAKGVGTQLERQVAYDFAVAPGPGLLGFFPCHISSPEWEGSELCEVADMIALALKLSEAGVGDYWDDADRWIRNMFAEGQLLSTDWISRVPENMFASLPSWAEPHTLKPSPVKPYDTTDRVAERCLGTFAGWPAANDWYVGSGVGIAYCCTANSAHTIYRTWERMLRHQDGKLRVNLLLNRASPWADVESYIPYQGRVDVKVKQPVDLAVRIPEWVAPGETRCRVNGRDRNLGWDGRYAQVGSVLPQDLVSLSFPIFERTNKIRVEKQRFTIVRKGNDVVSIDPPGRYNPLYQRQHYRDDEPRWRRFNRFVSTERIDW